MNDETIRLILDLANSSKDTAEFAEKLKGLKGSAEARPSRWKRRPRPRTGWPRAGQLRPVYDAAWRIVQDFQGGGLLGITNNIEGMAMSLGLGGGIAGVATLAAVALAALQPQIKALIASFNQGAPLSPKPKR